MNKVIFAGHGALNAISDAGKPKFTVPAGITLIFWVPHGSKFAGSELDGGDPDTLLSYMFQPGVRNIVNTSVGRRGDRPRAMQIPKSLTSGMPEKIHAGQQCWNYRLTPPVGLNLKPKLGDPNFITVKDRHPWKNYNSEAQKRGIGYRLEWLLETYKQQCFGAEVHWAACRVVNQR